MARLYDLGESSMCFYFFSRKDELVVNIEQNKKAAYDQCPLREEAESKLKRHTAQETEEERGIAKRGQQPGRVAHDKYEENNQMSPMPPQMICS